MIPTFHGMHYDYYPVINCFQIENYVERSLSGDMFPAIQFDMAHSTLDSWMDEDLTNYY